VLILLTHANHILSDRKQARKMQPYPPLQTLIAASLLRNQGYEVVFVDTTFDREITPAIRHFEPDLVAVCEDNFNFVTKMCLLENRRFAFEVAETCASRGIPAVVNSSDSSDHPAEYLAAGFDRVILGELESTLLDLVRNWPENAAGTVWQQDSRIRFGPPRAPIADLDDLPPPAWDMADLGRYRAMWLQAHGYFSLNLVASRGCPYRCNWCAKPLYGDYYRHQSPDRVASEMECVKDRFQPDQIWFADDIFGLSARWTRDFAGCVERRNAAVPFRMQSRCDLMTRDTVESLKRAGCVEVWMGAESGSQKVLDAMEKGVRVEQIHEARRNLGRHGVRACFFLQLGYLGEEWEDLEQTIQMVRETRPDDIGVSVSYPLPNTKFHQIVQARAPIGHKLNWSDSGDLEMMFRGTFPSEFYRALAQALHQEVSEGPDSEACRDAWDKVEQMRCACC
jgi:radical SAM superfamily enzyme YgiQ (UPF0313 family)